MAGTNSIYFDYRHALRQADRLEEIAGNIKNMSNSEFEDALDELMHGWEGEASHMYFQKGMELKTKIDSVSKHLYDAASTLRTVARRLYEADMAAVSIIKLKSR